MSQESSEISDEMSQESVEEMVREMVEKEMKGWQKEEIEENYRLVMMHYNLDVQISAAEEKNKKMDDLIEESLETLQTKENLLLKHQQRKKETLETQKEAEAFHKDLANRVEALEAMQRLQICPQAEYYLKAVTNVTNKIKELSSAKKACNESHDEEMAKINLFLGAIAAEEAHLDEEEAKLRQKVDEIDAALMKEEEETKAIQEKIRESQGLTEELQAINDKTKELEVLLDAERQRLNQSRALVDEFQRENLLVQQQIEESKTDQALIAAQAEALEKQLEEFNLLAAKIQSKPSYEELEADEIFRREIMNEPFYMEDKQKSNMIMLENEELDREMARTMDAKEQLEGKLEELKKAQAETDEVVEKLQLEVKAMTEEAEKQEAIRNLEKAKARELQAECLEKEEEVENFRNKSAKALAELNMKLKIEQEKTQKLREERNRVYSQIIPIVDERSTRPASQQVQETPRAFLVTPPLSSSFDSAQSSRNRSLSTSVDSNIPVYKNAIKNQPEAIEEDAFSDNEDSFNVTFNTDIEDFMDETLSAV